MLKKYDEKIGFREFFVIILFSIGIKLSDTTPILLIKSGLNAAWILPIVSGLIILVPFLFLLSLLKLYKSKSLIDIVYHLTGKFFGFVIVLSLLLISFEYLIISTRDYTDILSTMFYLKTPMKYLLIMLIVSSIYIASKGINVVGSLCWFTYPILQVVVLFLITTIWKQLDFNYLFPFGGPGIKLILKEGFTYTSIVSEVIILTIFFPQVRSYKEFRNSSLLGLGLSIFFITLFMIIYISAYGYPTLSTINYPYHQLTRLIHLGRFARNMEAFFLGFWVIGTTIRFGIYFAAAAAIASSIIKVNNSKTLLPYIAIIVFLIALIPDNFTKYTLSIRKFGITALWIYLITLPLLLWVIAKLKGAYKS